jgi:hypothetical protein
VQPLSLLRTLEPNTLPVAMAIVARLSVLGIFRGEKADHELRIYRMHPSSLEGAVSHGETIVP